MPKYVINLWDGNKNEETKHETRGLLVTLSKNKVHFGTISVLFVKLGEIDLNVVGAQIEEVKEVKL